MTSTKDKLLSLKVAVPNTPTRKISVVGVGKSNNLSLIKLMESNYLNNKRSSWYGLCIQHVSSRCLQ